MEQLRHRLLDRQIRKYLNDLPQDHPGLSAFIEAINEAYIGFEKDHDHLERTLEISSQELFKANQALNDAKKGLEETVQQRTSELLSTNEKLVSEINERKEAEEKLKSYARELETKNNELDKFAYVVSHDLKAPLRAISSLAHWIQEDMDDALLGESRNHFELLKGRASRMEALINGILEYSRVGRIKTECHMIDTYHFVKDLVSALSPPKQFKVRIDRGLPKLITEKVSLEQVFSNYISNAIRYNDNPHPEISITYKEVEENHVFCVADNGAGIEPAYHDKIFVIFQTLNARDKYESTGVGLAIVKKIVLEKGGKVWIESDKDQGAKFYFSLPFENGHGKKEKDTKWQLAA